MYIHPDLGRQLAQGKINEALSKPQRVHALREASLDGSAQPLRAGSPDKRAPALHVVRARLRANARWTTNG
jgi:hypothetical protein